MGIVGRGSKNGIVLGNAQSPCIIAGAGQEFKIAKIPIETIDPLSKLEVFTKNLPLKTRVAHYSVYFIVDSVLQIGGTRMGIECTPTIYYNFPDVCLVVPVRIH